MVRGFGRSAPANGSRPVSNWWMTRQSSHILMRSTAAWSLNIQCLSASLATIRTGQVGLDIVTSTADELRQGGTHDETPRAATRFAGDITLQEVEYRYPDAERPVLEGISLDILQNQTTAFVGSSGAGKCSLIVLVLGMMVPTAGRIV